MKYLIVNADDYGHTPGVSAGIRKAHLNGIVTSTSAMMNSPHIEEELPRLIELCPHIGIGVHLIMTSGKPLLPVDALPVLMSLSEDGISFMHDPQEQIDRIDVEEIRAEWRTQIDKFIGIAGRTPDHLDAHHHAMCFSPGLFQIYMELASEYGCAIRRPTLEFEKQYLQSSTSGDQPVLQDLWGSVKMPDWFDGRFYDEQVSGATLKVMIAELRDGVGEWMCHPAQVDQEILKKSIYNIRRGEELELLVQPEYLQRIEESGVKLVSFGIFSNSNTSMSEKTGVGQ